LGQTSKKKYMSFFRGFDLLGMTKRMMCMSRPVCASPLSMMERIFFCWSVRRPGTSPRGYARREAHHGLDLLLIAALLEGCLELILRGHIGRIVLVHL
jgi:hypothetical protein